MLRRCAVRPDASRLPWNCSDPAMKGGLEPGDELATEDAAEHLDREEEAAAKS